MVDVIDPYVDPEEAQAAYGLTVLQSISTDFKYNAL